MPFLTLATATCDRILELCEQHRLTVNGLCYASGITPSTLFSLLNRGQPNPRLSTLKKLCDGLDITLQDFFDSDLFRNLDQEIQ